jgi:pimeloyl-ACP methyl ester carboxylesterase
MSTWIFLRGLTREARHWGDFPAIFRDTLADARVVALDLPGNGELNRLASPFTVEAYARHVRAELLRRGLAPPYHLLAMSLGAMVAVAWCAHHPQEIDACVLVNTSLRPFSPFFRRLVPLNYLTLATLGLSGDDPARRERAILRLTSRHAASPDEVLGEWIRFRRERPVSAANALRQLFAAARFRAPAVAPRPPTLILAGRRDALVDPRCSHDIVRRWQCRLAEHPTAGHDLPLDDGRWVAREVGNWLASTMAPGAALATPPAGFLRAAEPPPR